MRYKGILVVFVVFASLILLSSVFVLAVKPNFVPVEVVPSDGQASVIIPENAVEVAPDVFDLGLARDVDGRIVRGYAFVHRKDSEAKPPWAGGGNGDSSTCYSVLAKGAKWKSAENYLVDSANNDGLTQSFVENNVEASVNTWEAETSSNIFGSQTAGVVDGIDTASTDGKNEFLFASMPNDPNTIAVTITWGIFYGPPQGRELVEWDMAFNDDFAFGDADVLGNNVMDFLNIMTHEKGHALGLGHPSDGCTEETMFRFASAGETKKRTLEAGDIAGLKSLYG